MDSSINRTSYDMAKILENKGPWIIGKDLYTGIDIPTKPDKILFISDSGSNRPDISCFDPYGVYDISVSSFQVIARGTAGGINDCYNRIIRVRNQLHRLPRIQIGNKLYFYTRHQWGPQELSLDELMRPYVSMNFIVHIAWYMLEGYNRFCKKNITTFTNTTGILSIIS